MSAVCVASSASSVCGRRAESLVRVCGLSVLPRAVPRRAGRYTGGLGGWAGGRASSAACIINGVKTRRKGFIHRWGYGAPNSYQLLKCNVTQNCMHTKMSADWPLLQRK